MRGRWADGIVPRNLIWILKDRLAVCERPGGYGSNHRSVRRTEEIIWIRRNEFTCVVSLLTGRHNLHNYDEHDIPYLHVPLSEAPQAAELLEVYEELTRRMVAQELLLVHHEKVDDVLGGLLAGYLLWTGRFDEIPEALSAAERLLRRPMGRQGRETVMTFARAGITRVDSVDSADSVGGAGGTDIDGAGSDGDVAGGDAGGGAE